ncbi:MAG: glycosyltransferase family 39 protein [Myxococcales bacterium]|nr:glycosyltransferase family 39 protein [Myxococcales bacterium]
MTTPSRALAAAHRAIGSLGRSPEWVSWLSLFGISALVRFAYRNAGLFHFDAVRLAEAVEKTYATGVLHGYVNGRHGSVAVNLLLYVPYHWWTAEVSAEVTLIATNVLAGSLAVSAFYSLVRALGEGRAGAFAAAAMFSMSPIFLSVTTFGKPHGLEVLFVVSSLLCLARYHQGGALRLALAGSALMGMAVFCRESALIYLPLFGLLALHPRIALVPPRFDLPSRSRRFGPALALWGPLLGMVALAWVFFLEEVVVRTLTHRDTATVSFVGLWTPFLMRAFSDLWIDLGGIGLALAVLGGWAWWRRGEDKLPLVLMLAWSSLIFYVGNTNAYSPRLLAPVSPPFFALAGAGIGWIHERTRLLGVALMLTVAVSGFLTVQPIIADRSVFSGPKAYALWLKENVPPDSVILCMNEPFLSYYAGLTPRYHPLDGRQETMDKFFESLQESIAAGTHVFVMPTAFYPDPKRLFRRGLQRWFEVTVVGQHPYEDYHQSTLKRGTVNGKLLRLSLPGERPSRTRQRRRPPR